MNAPATLIPPPPASPTPRAGAPARPSRPSVRAAPPSCGPTAHRITVAEYHAMRDADVFPPDGPKLELIDGEILEMPAPNPPHAATVDGIAGRLLRRLPDGWFVRVQNPVTFLTSEPLPGPAGRSGRGLRLGGPSSGAGGRGSAHRGVRLLALLRPQPQGPRVCVGGGDARTGS